MTVQLINDPPKPGTSEWRQLITASKVAGILGLSPWTSPYRMWHEMAGLLEPEAVSDSKQKIFSWGHSAELAIADWWGKQNPEWELSEGEVAYTNTDLPFPNLITADRIATHRETGQQKLLEFKTANSLDSLNKWGRPSEADAVPAPYLVQHYFQRGVSNILDGEVVLQCLGTPEVHHVNWDQSIYDAIVERCTEFWNSIESGQAPPLDDTTATLEAVRGIHKSIDKDTSYEISVEEAVSLFWLKEAEDEAKKKMNRLKSGILTRMLKSQRLTCGGHIVATRVAGKGGTVNLRFNAKAKEAILNEH